MESLESKLDRLSPEQRKEIEDFVDFLLSRSGQVCTPPNASRDTPPVLNVAPPRLTLIEPVHVMETQPVRLQELARTDDRTAASDQRTSQFPPRSRRSVAGSDRITHDYMDYGQFEHQPSLGNGSGEEGQTEDHCAGGAGKAPPSSRLGGLIFSLCHSFLINVSIPGWRFFPKSENSHFLAVSKSPGDLLSRESYENLSQLGHDRGRVSPGSIE